MSGTGKSTIVQELRKRGFNAIDLDYDNWSYYNEKGEWVWNEERIEKLLQSIITESLVVAGCAENQGKFYSYFDKIILLCASVETILKRVQTRTNNPYGKKKEEIAEIVNNIEYIEPILRKGSTNEINTEKSILEIIDEIITLIASK